MNAMMLIAKIAELNAWIKENESKTQAALNEREETLLRNLGKEFQDRIYMLLPPGKTCVHCRGTGVTDDA